MHLVGFLAAESGDASNFVDIDVQPWQWVVLLAIIVVLLMVDILVIHRKPHEIHLREAAIESADLDLDRPGVRARDLVRGSAAPRPASTCRAT